MYLSKYIRRCDFMDNMNTMDFNQKIDVSLRASLEATPVERNASDDLSTGSSSDGFWDLIVLYTGSPQTLQNEFPSSSFTFLLGNYAIVKISEDDIPSLAAFPQVMECRPRIFSLWHNFQGRHSITCRLSTSNIYRTSKTAFL